MIMGLPVPEREKTWPTPKEPQDAFEYLERLKTRAHAGIGEALKFLGITINIDN